MRVRHDLPRDFGALSSCFNRGRRRRSYVFSGGEEGSGSGGGVSPHHIFGFLKLHLGANKAAPIKMKSGDPEIFVTEHSYDPRVSDIVKFVKKHSF